MHKVSATSEYRPIIERAGSQQQPARDGNVLLLFSAGEAAAEIDDQNDEERNIPGGRKQTVMNSTGSPLESSTSLSSDYTK